MLAPPAGASISSGGVITWTPDEMQGPGTNIITNVVTDNGTPSLSATNSFSVVINEINVPPVLSAFANTNVNELTTLTLTNSATDSDVPVNALTYTLIEAPAGAAIDTNGVITWTPTEAQGPSTNTFTTIVTDTNIWAVNTQSFTVTNTFTVVANEINMAPMLTVPANTNIDELVAYSAQATAVDPDIPINTLTFALVSGPAGLTVSPGGAINWTPDEMQGSTTNLVVIQVTDFNPWAINSQHLSMTNSYEIVVNEVNVAPVLPPALNTNVNELVTLTVTNTATDSDLPANPLTYLLLASPSGAAIDTNGVIIWTPTEMQGPSTNTFTTVVTDTNNLAVNAKSLSATNSFTIVINEINVAPVLTLPADTNINEQVAYTSLATATDADVPTNKLTFALVSGPVGLTVSTNGTIRWTPDEAQGPSTNTVLISVTDTNVLAMNSKSLSVTNSYEIVVNEVNKAPIFGTESIPYPNPTINELQPYTFTLAAVDADLPTNQLTYELVSGPAGMTVSTNGAINWTPTEAQGGEGLAGHYDIQVRVVDYNPQAVNATSLSNQISFAFQVREVNSTPVLPAITDTNINELTTLTVTNTATDNDIPTNTLDYILVNPPVGVTIDTNGVITWTPTEAQGPSTNVITTIVTDYNPDATTTQHLSATNFFSVVVNEINVPPVLSSLADMNINELATLTVTNMATDSDLPANTLTYVLLAPPSGATIDTNGVITWTPTETQGPSTNTFITIVTDTNSPAANAQSLSTTNMFSVVVNEVNSAPVLNVIGSQTDSPGQTISFTAIATDADVPTNTLSFTLISAPPGAAIDSGSGLFNWRLPASWANTTNQLQVQVTDNGTPNLSDIKLFTIIVNPAGHAARIDSKGICQQSLGFLRGRKHGAGLHHHDQHQSYNVERCVHQPVADDAIPVCRYQCSHFPEPILPGAVESVTKTLGAHDRDLGNMRGGTSGGCAGFCQRSRLIIKENFR
ncbi:MAG: putative Ig domain-containing protein [Limisphaerales bacterium]